MSIDERLNRIEQFLIIMGKEALTTKDLSILIRKSEDRIRHLTSKREIPHYKQGESVFFKKSEIWEWMLAKRIPTNEEIDAEAAIHCLRNRKR